MRSETPSSPRLHVLAREDESNQHLMLDPRPREVMNHMVLEAMQKTSLRYWIALIVLSLLVAILLFGAWGNMIATGMGLAGIRLSSFLGYL